MDPKIIENDIITLLGLQNLPPEEQQMLVAKMSDVIMERVTLRILDALSPEDKKAFDALIAQNAAPERVEEFLQGKVKDLEAIRTAEILRFKQDLADDVEALKAKLAANTPEPQN